MTLSPRSKLLATAGVLGEILVFKLVTRCLIARYKPQNHGNNPPFSKKSLYNLV